MTRKAKLFILFGISLLSFTGYLDATIVSTALPDIQKTIHCTVTQLQWVVNANFLGMSACMVLMGRVADIFGRRKAIYCGAILFGIASIGAALSTNIYWLIAFRALLGISTAINLPVGISLINHNFAKKEVAKAVGLFSGITGAGLALGPLIGGILVGTFGWPAIFYVNIPFIIVGLVLCFYHLKESRSKVKMTLDYWGAIFLVITIVSFIFGMVEATTFGWGSPVILMSFAIAIVALIILIIVENKIAMPLLPMYLFKNRSFLTAGFFMITGAAMMNIVLFINPLYISNVLDENAFMTGVILFAIPLFMSISSPLLGHLNQKIGPKNLILIGAILYTVSALGHMFFPININWTLIIVAFALFGIAWAVVNQGPAVKLTEEIEADHQSSALGALYSLYNIGAALGLAVGVTIFQSVAFNRLQQSFMNLHLPFNSQIQKLLHFYVTHPDKIKHVIAKLGLAHPGMTQIFDNAFVAGMHQMFIVALLMSVLSFFLVWFFMPSKK